MIVYDLLFVVKYLMSLLKLHVGPVKPMQTFLLWTNSDLNLNCIEFGHGWLHSNNFFVKHVTLVLSK